MNICLRCGKYPFCNGIEENKKECDKFIKRKLDGEIRNENNRNYNSNNFNNYKYNSNGNK